MTRICLGFSVALFSTPGFATQIQCEVLGTSGDYQNISLSTPSTATCEVHRETLFGIDEELSLVVGDASCFPETHRQMQQTWIRLEKKEKAKHLVFIAGAPIFQNRFELLVRVKEQVFDIRCAQLEDIE